MKDYDYIIVESFIPSDLTGRHGPVHIRALEGQEPYTSDLFVQCSKSLSENYEVGTRFKIRAKITNREGTPYISSHYTWDYEVL